MRKTTLKDVAAEAGVSIATASYVLNKVTNQTIPDETKQRVFEAAAKLNYVQNLAARSLSSGRSNLLGVLLVGEEADLISKYMSYGRFIDELEQACRSSSYHLMVSRIDPNRPDFAIIAERKLDGVFLIDAHESSFYQVSEKFPYGSPLLLVDGSIEDTLFRKLTPDYDQLFRTVRERIGGTSPYAVIHESYHNQATVRMIGMASGLDSERIKLADGDEELLQAFAERHKDSPIVVFNEFLALRLLARNPSLDLLVVCTSGCPEYLPERVGRLLPKVPKAQLAAAMMRKLLENAEESLPDGLIEFE
ncbi:LacI family DNA-binding transcriptional regulator [Cohnella sp. AR92]|uniref:LacI family DNA-binding transcriptional regulator n=1 Tax=Cohnella sp. AR92 TaxID=648716 RepID=UPI000F8DAE78|nr:LacI family DNA-binding transcriptional regulator [Cohnella sp. AR92]RUS46520.1 LacI family transcriptional regulator [Cohnella sp. AR92]